MNCLVKLKRHYAKENSVMMSKRKIHQAVLDGGQFDPYIGEEINRGPFTGSNRGFARLFLRPEAFTPFA